MQKMRRYDITKGGLVPRCLRGGGFGGGIPRRSGCRRDLNIIHQMPVVICGRGQIVSALPLIIDNKFEAVSPRRQTYDCLEDFAVVRTIPRRRSTLGAQRRNVRDTHSGIILIRPRHELSNVPASLTTLPPPLHVIVVETSPSEASSDNEAEDPFAGRAIPRGMLLCTCACSGVGEIKSEGRLGLRGW